MSGRPKGLPKTGGRQKGTPNKRTRAAQEAIELAAEGIGGAERLTAWVKESPENERAFWVTIYPKLLPLQVNAQAQVTGDVSALSDGELAAIARPQMTREEWLTAYAYNRQT